VHWPRRPRRGVAVGRVPGRCAAVGEGLPYRKMLLSNSYVVLAGTLGLSRSWNSALFEWFRTYTVVTSPGHHAARAGTMHLEIFAAGHLDIYFRLSGPRLAHSRE